MRPVMIAVAALAGLGLAPARAATAEEATAACAASDPDTAITACTALSKWRANPPPICRANTTIAAAPFPPRANSPTHSPISTRRFNWTAAMPGP